MKKLVCLTLSIILLFQSGLYAVPFEAYRSYLRGLFALKVGNVDHALMEYRRVIALDKEAALAYKDLAQIFLQTGKIKDALYCAEKLGELRAGDLDTKLFLGNFYLMAGYPEKAKVLWEEIIEQDPSNEAATIYLAAYYSERELPKAVEFWEKYLQKKPNSGGGYYNLGLVEEKLGKIEKAKESYRKAAGTGIGGQDAHLALAQLYEKQGSIDEAISEYKLFLESVPENLSALLYLGGLYYRVKKYDDALECFQKALGLNPKDVNVHFWIGLIAEEKKDWNLAVNSFEILRKEEETSAVLVRLSYYYSNLKDYESSMKCLERAGVIDPHNPNIYYLLGLTFVDKKNTKKAEKCFRKALDLDPKFEEVYFHLGVLYDMSGRFKKAIPYFEKAIALKPDYAAALNYLGYSFIDKDMEIDKAEHMIRKALAINPDSGPYTDSIGWACFKRGKYQEAKDYLSRAASKISDPVVFEHLGDVEVKLQNYAEAWDAYQKARAIDPKNRKLAKKISNLDKFVLPGTVQRKVLKRAIGNLLQIRTLKLSFTASLKMDSLDIRNFGTFQYISPDKWRVDIIGGFLAPKITMIQNGAFSVYPQALSEQANSSYFSSLSTIERYFSSKLLEAFDNEKTSIMEKGCCFQYKIDGKTLLIDKHNGWVKEYSDDKKLCIKISEQDNYEGLDLPTVMSIAVPKDKMTARIKIKNMMLNRDLGEKAFSVE